MSRCCLLLTAALAVAATTALAQPGGGFGARMQQGLAEPFAGLTTSRQNVAQGHGESAVLALQ